MRFALILTKLDPVTNRLHDEEHARYVFRADAMMVGDNPLSLYPEWIKDARVERVKEAKEPRA